LGLVLALIAVAQIVGALIGATDPLQPLKPLTARLAPAAAAHTTQAELPALPFKRINSALELDAALQQAHGQPVMLDFYAEWCVACKEMDRFTFADLKVQQRLRNVVLLQADVTANTPQHQALMKRFGIYGPPGILFFGANGQEHEDARVIGFQKPDDFLKSLGAVLPLP
jgi:thiol:disulfide interchange protein DsbD